MARIRMFLTRMVHNDEPSNESLLFGASFSN